MTAATSGVCTVMRAATGRDAPGSGNDAPAAETVVAWVEQKAIKELMIFLQGVDLAHRRRRAVDYGFDELDELDCAYAVTIHCSQGSEYPAVVIPLTTSSWMMLQRNLLYTGITRARKLVVLAGSRRALAAAIRTKGAGRRHTALPTACIRTSAPPEQAQHRTRLGAASRRATVTMPRRPDSSCREVAAQDTGSISDSAELRSVACTHVYALTDMLMRGPADPAALWRIPGRRCYSSLDEPDRLI